MFCDGVMTAARSKLISVFSPTTKTGKGFELDQDAKHSTPASSPNPLGISDDKS